jgi:hypothetical protein
LPHCSPSDSCATRKATSALPKDFIPWNPGEFTPQTLTHPNGEKSTLQLAERGTRLTNGLWVREIRALSETGHQTAILSTDYRSDLARSAATMFAR